MKKVYLLSSLILSLAVFSFGQGTERMIDFLPNQPQYPTNKVENGKLTATDMKAVELVGISVEGKPITLGKTFTASDDWLKTLIVKLKNVSDKPIAAVSLSFVQPEAKIGDSYYGFSLAFGTLSATFDKKPLERIIKPGEEFEISRSEQLYQQGKAMMIEKTGVSNITKVLITTTTIKFESGEMWLSWKIPPVK